LPFRCFVLDEEYEQVGVALAKGEKDYWPSTALDDFDINVETTVISFNDEAAAKRLKDHIARHRTLLCQAKEGLRNFLKDDSSIEEVPFQNDRHPWR